MIEPRKRHTIMYSLAVEPQGPEASTIDRNGVPALWGPKCPYETYFGVSCFKIPTIFTERNTIGGGPQMDAR